MKLYKILTLALGMLSLSFTSCGGDDDEHSTNSAPNVVVEMAQPEISFLESKGIVKVPVKVEGTANGYVTVTCQVAEYGQPNVAMEDVHYYLTSPTINIADGDNSGYFEFNLVDNREINESKFFQITLVNAQGATIGSNNTTVVEIQDNDDKPYDRLDGMWEVVYMNSGNKVTKDVILSSYPSDHYAYGMSYRLFGIFGDADTSVDDDGNFTKPGVYPINVMFNYDESTEEGDLSIALDQTLGNKTIEDTNTTVSLKLAACVLDGENIVDLITSGKYILTWNEDATVLSFVQTPDGEDMANMGVYFVNNGRLGLQDAFTGIIEFRRK